MESHSPLAESETETTQKITVDALNTNEVLVRVGDKAVKAFYGESAKADAEKYAEQLMTRR